jgi:putative ABC transport system permease protein
MMSKPAPPRLPSRIIEMLAPPEDRAELLGDLHERFMDRMDALGRGRARSWYWRQAIPLTARLFVGLMGAILRRLFTVPDLRCALRALMRSPITSLVAVVTLAVGIGAPSAMFAFADAMMKPLPTDGGEVVVDVSLSDRSTGQSQRVSIETFRQWRDLASGNGAGLLSLGAYSSDRVAVSGEEGDPARYPAAYVSSEVFEVLGVRPVTGRMFSREDAAPGAPPLALIREDLWIDRFDRDPEVIGRTVRIDGLDHTIVGVMPADFGFPSRQRLWMTLHQRGDGYGGIELVGRLREGALPERVEEELLVLAGRLPEGPLDDLVDPVVRVQEYVAAFYAEDAGPFRNIVRLATILMILSAANVASVMLARGASRAGETSVRMAIGGSRVRVLAQLIYEAAILSFAGAVAGLGIVAGTLALIRWQFNVANAPFWVTLELGSSSVWFAAMLAGGAVVVAGVLPAVRSSRVELSDALKPQGRGAASLTGGALFPAIVGIEVTLSCAMLLLSGIIIKDAITESSSSAGFAEEGVLTGRMVLEDFDYPNPEARTRFTRGLSGALEADAGVARFAFTTRLPGKDGDRFRTRVAGERYDEALGAPIAQVRSVSPSFFNMLELKSVQGRLVEEGDLAGTERVAVVNEAFARERFADGQVVGSAIGLGSAPDASPLFTIVGIVSDAQATPLEDGRPSPGVYLAMAQTVPEGFYLMAMSPGVVSPLPILKEAIASLDSHLPLGEVMTLKEVMRQERSDERLLLGIFGSFGCLALLLAAVGLNGVVSLTASKRTRELGIRRALGATQGGVLRKTIGRGLKPVAIGVVVGSLLGRAIVPVFDGELLTADSGDLIVYGAIPVLLISVCILATLGPALRAAAREPMEVLRED